MQSTTQMAGEILCGLGTGLLVFFHFIAFTVVLFQNQEFDESKVRNRTQITKGDFEMLSVTYTVHHLE